MSKDIAIAFFSRSGENYKVGSVEKGSGALIAGMIEKAVDARAYEIARKRPYPESYEECNKDAEEERKANDRPELRDPVPQVSEKRLILVYPNWWGDLPMPVYTFLDSIDTDGLEIDPVCTHEGNGIGFTEKCISQVYPKAKVMKGLALKGSDVQKDSAGTEAAITRYLASAALI